MDAIPKLLPSQYELLVTFRGKARPWPSDRNEEACWLKDQKLIEGVGTTFTQFGPQVKEWITSQKGEYALEWYEHIADEKAEQAREQVKNRKVQILSAVIGSVLGFLLGLVSGWLLRGLS